MNVNGEEVDISPGKCIVHPPGELHEYVNGPERSILFRVRYGDDMAARIKEWPSYAHRSKQRKIGLISVHKG